MNYTTLSYYPIESPEEFIQNLILPIFQIVVTGVISPVFVYVLKRIFDEKWANKTEYIWKEIIQRNRSVKNCQKDFRNLGAKNFWWFMYIYAGFFGGLIFLMAILFLSFFLAKYLSSIDLLDTYFNEHDKELESLFSLCFSTITCVSSLVFLYTSEKIHNYGKSINEENLFRKYNNFINYSLANALAIAVYSLFLYPLLFIILKDEIVHNYLLFNACLSIFSIAIPIFSLYNLYLSKKAYIQRVKSYLNFKYHRTFPYILIRTSVGGEVEGRLADVFSSKYILLSTEKNTEITLLRSIDVLKVNYGKMGSPSKQKKLIDFPEKE